jgi:hypothetical protein
VLNKANKRLEVYKKRLNLNFERDPILNG